MRGHDTGTARQAGGVEGCGLTSVAVNGAGVRTGYGPQAESTAAQAGCACCGRWLAASLLCCCAVQGLHAPVDGQHHGAASVHKARQLSPQSLVPP